MHAPGLGKVEPDTMRKVNNSVVSRVARIVAK